MKSTVKMPVIIAAVIGLIVLLVIMGKIFLKGPDVGSIPPPSWIDPATGKPKMQMKGSSPSGGSPEHGSPNSGSPGSGSPSTSGG